MRIPVTATLAVLALIMAIIIGIPLGVASSIRGSRGLGSATGRVIAGIGISVPEFVLATIALFIVAAVSPKNADVGTHGVGDTAWSTIRGLVIPAAVLGVYCLSVLARTTHDAVRNVLVEPHIMAATARGESTGHILLHHVLRNALVPVITVLGTLSAYLLGGAVLVETVFNIPGIGSYMVSGLGRHDYAVVQATVLLTAAAFIVINTVIDVVSSILDPRIATDGVTA